MLATGTMFHAFRSHNSRRCHYGLGARYVLEANGEKYVPELQNKIKKMKF